MQRSISNEEVEKAGTYTIERVHDQVTAYEPLTDEAKALDKAVNLKLDFIVVLILAIDFILCGIDKTNIGYVATTSKCFPTRSTNDTDQSNIHGERCESHAR